MLFALRVCPCTPAPPSRVHAARDVRGPGSGPVQRGTPSDGTLAQRTQPKWKRSELKKTAAHMGRRRNPSPARAEVLSHEGPQQLGDAGSGVPFSPTVRGTLIGEHHGKRQESGR